VAADAGHIGRLARRVGGVHAGAIGWVMLTPLRFLPGFSFPKATAVQTCP
jgi:hypothetical protein